MNKPTQAAILQDAIHYALAACPDGYVASIGETTFTGRTFGQFEANKTPSRGDFVKHAVKKALEGGLDIKSRWLVRDAVLLAQTIDRLARAEGIEAYAGSLAPSVDPLAGYRDMSFSNHKNETERQIVVRLVDSLLDAGYSVGVHDGEEHVLRPCRSRSEIFAAMSTTDEDYLIFEREVHPGNLRLVHGTPVVDTKVCGWIRLIYGNGCDVLSDYTTNIDESVLKPALDLADQFAG
jgi:hypothetical protein